MPRIALAAGGTPGHIVPALALAEELEERGWEAVFVGTRRGSGDAILSAAAYGQEIVPGEPFQREGLGGRLRALTRLGPSIIAARKLLPRPLPNDGSPGSGSSILDHLDAVS